MKMQNVYDEYAFIHATKNTEYAAAKELFIEYAKTLDFDLCFQNFEDELNELNIMYNEPDGGLILIKESLTGEYIGCAGIRKIEDRISRRDVGVLEAVKYLKTKIK